MTALRKNPELTKKVYIMNAFNTPKYKIAQELEITPEKVEKIIKDIYTALNAQTELNKILDYPNKKIN